MLVGVEVEVLLGQHVLHEAVGVLAQNVETLVLEHQHHEVLS